MKNIILALVVLVSFSGCIKEDECNYDACSYVAPSSEIQSVQAYLTTNGLVATQHCSGLFYRIDQPGSGTKPNACDNVVVGYEGKLTDGSVFDKTQPGAPASFDLSRLIAGFKNAVPLIGAGGKITVYLPPSLGYGSASQPGIPANSILIFTVELVSFQ